MSAEYKAKRWLGERVRFASLLEGDGFREAGAYSKVTVSEVEAYSKVTGFARREPQGGCDNARLRPMVRATLLDSAKTNFCYYID